MYICQYVGYILQVRFSCKFALFCNDVPNTGEQLAFRVAHRRNVSLSIYGAETICRFFTKFSSLFGEHSMCAHADDVVTFFRNV